MFPQHKQNEILTIIEVDDKEEVEELLSYPDDSRSIMTKELLLLIKIPQLKKALNNFSHFLRMTKYFIFMY